MQDTSRRIEVLVSPQCVRFKWQIDGRLQLFRPADAIGTVNWSRRTAFFGQQNQKSSGYRSARSGSM